jgi:hypothetical protein
VTALGGLALLTIGAILAGPLWYRLAVRDERGIRELQEATHQAELAAIDRAVKRLQAELETGDGLAEAADFEAWSRELREEAS